MRTLPLLLAFFIIGSLGHGAEDQTKRAEELLKSLPTQAVLNKSQDIFKNQDTASEEEKQNAQEAIGKAKLIIPQLRKLIAVGRSVFDYPGLLGRGTIQWKDTSYTLYVGVYLRSDQGTEPFDMRITFDSAGKIVAVEDVIWKN